MVCEGLTTLECSYLLSSQQDIKMMFIVGFYIIFTFIWYFFNKKRTDKIKKTYYIMPLITARWSGLLYFLFTPVHFLLFQSDLDYNIVLGWFSLYYIPSATIILLMPILWIFDRIFILLGYENTFEFIKKYKERVF